MVEQIFQRKYSNFKARHVVIITYRDIPLRTDPSKRHTFQLVIGFNGDVSRGLYNYVRLDASGATVGHSIGACKTTIYSSSQESKNMSKTSNTDVSGRHMFTLSEKSCSDKIGKNLFSYDLLISHDLSFRLSIGVLALSKFSDRIKFKIQVTARPGLTPYTAWPPVHSTNCHFGLYLANWSIFSALRFGSSMSIDKRSSTPISTIYQQILCISHLRQHTRYDFYCIDNHFNPSKYFY